MEFVRVFQYHSLPSKNVNKKPRMLLVCRAMQQGLHANVVATEERRNASGKISGGPFKPKLFTLEGGCRVIHLEVNNENLQRVVRDLALRGSPQAWEGLIQ